MLENLASKHKSYHFFQTIVFREFENAIAAEIENGTLSAPLLNIYYFHSATFDQELAKEQDRIIPK